VGLRLGRKSKWDGVLFGVLSGPTYDGAANQGLINANYPTNPANGQPILTWIFKRDPYWLVNGRLSYQLNRQLRLFAGVNNLLNLNYDPAYLALNQVNATYTLNPYKSQSRQTTGSSSPGREFFGGVQYSL
jgi:outer membrane receptor protein involved in Fe transport